MATPHVSGVAALVWSQFPNKKAHEIREALTSTALDFVQNRSIYIEKEKGYWPISIDLYRKSQRILINIDKFDHPLIALQKMEEVFNIIQRKL